MIALECGCVVEFRDVDDQLLVTRLCDHHLDQLADGILSNLSLGDEAHTRTVVTTFTELRAAAEVKRKEEQ